MLTRLAWTLSLLTVVTATSIAQPGNQYLGTWEGLLDVGAKLRIVFHIGINSDRQLVSTTDSPDQEAYGIECDTTFINDKGITIEMRKLKASFSGKLVNDSTIEGSLMQGMSFPLVLNKGVKLTARNRPQTPQPPFPYESYDVEYDNRDKTVHFGATLTIPKADPSIRYIKAPEYPVAILITGSGGQDRDETIMDHKPFAVIADHLTRHGYAVLRVDDRGVGKTTGDVTKVTSADFAKDVETGIEYLKTRKEIDKNKIGLIGHSEGGMIAQIIASRRKDIYFIIMLASPGIKNIDLMAEQNADIYRTAGVGEPAVKSFVMLYKKIVSILLTAKDSIRAKAAALRTTKDWAANTSANIQRALNLHSAKEQQDLVNKLYSAIAIPWYKYFISFDPKPYLEKINSKVLALNGSRDIQVNSKSNLAGIERTLKKRKSSVTDIREVKGLNHLFQSCIKCTINEYGELEETFSPAVLEMMTDWLDKNVGHNP